MWKVERLHVFLCFSYTLFKWKACIMKIWEIWQIIFFIYFMNYPKDDVIKGQFIVGFFNSFICTTTNSFIYMHVCIHNITLLNFFLKITCVTLTQIFFKNKSLIWNDQTTNLYTKVVKKSTNTKFDYYWVWKSPTYNLINNCTCYKGWFKQ